MAQNIYTLDLDGVNSYLLEENGSYLLIDTGGPIMMDKTYNNRRTLLEEKLDSYGCTNANLKLILLTHGDIDHCGNAAYFSKKYQAPVGIHKNDVEMVEHLTIELFLKSCNYRSFSLKLMSRVIHKLIVKAGNSAVRHFEPFTPDLLLTDGQDLSSYGFHAKIIALPGHTLGSIGIYTDNQDLFCGDVYQCLKKPVPSPNAWDFPALERSLEYLHTLPVKHYYPGHGTTFTL